MFLQKPEIRNINLQLDIFFTKKLVSKFVFGVEKTLSVTFHLQTPSCVTWCLDDNHYQLVMTHYFVKFMINQYFSNLSLT